MLIDKYIYDLLFEHNCVILPEFGGFIANRSHAKINEVQHRIDPPRKTVMFNKNLRINDGLLANFVAEKNNESYEKAMIIVSEYIAKINSELQSKRHFEIKDIGDFYLNTENNIVFVANAGINFMKEAYGLRPVHLSEIVEANGETDIKEIPDKTRPAQEKRISKPFTINRRLMAAAAMIIIPAAFAWIGFTQNILHDNSINLSNLFPKALFSPAIKTETTPAENNSAIEAQTQPQPQTDNVPANQQPTASQPPEEKVLTTEPVHTEPKENVVVNIPAETYHIIGGQFAVKANAKRYVETLKLKGYDAYEAGLSDRGLNMVSFGKFTDKTIAEQQLKAIQQKEVSNAWIFISK